MSSNPHPPTQAWQQAVQQYITTLSPAHQLAFKAPATVDQCLQILESNRSRKKAFTRILEIFRPLIDTLKRFEGAIDVVVQVSSGIASPIWGPLRLAITVCSDHFKTLERLTFVVDKIACSIQRYQDFEALFASHDHVRIAIGALYLDLIDFCTRLIRFHSKTFRYPLVSFTGEFSSVSESIDLHSTEIDRAANAAHMKEAKALREIILAEKNVDELHQLQRWLSPSNVADDLQKHWSEYMSGSCDWINTAIEFREWHDASSSQSLKIVGRPGCGKSTLAAYLVQRLSSPACPVLYFFCDSNDSEKRDKSRILRTLLSQLLKVQPTLVTHLLPIYREDGRMFADSEQVIKTAFQTAIRQQQDQPLYLLIDAVDECNWPWDGNGLMDTLQSCIANTRVKLLITHRDVSIWYRSASGVRELTIVPHLFTDMIREYAVQRVEMMATIANTDLATQVVQQVSQSSDGLWLYARLLLDEVRRAPSAERVKQRLVALPHGLSDLYTQLLDSSESRMTNDHREFTRYLYVWLDVSDYMPRFLSDNYDRMPYHLLRLVFRFVNGGDEVFDPAGLAREIGAPLLKVHQVDSTYELDLVHRSAYQYLTESSKAEEKELPIVLRSQRLKQFYRGDTAVWYFSECTDSFEQLEKLKAPAEWPDFFVSDHINSYFAMAYGLWNIFKLSKLPSGLSQDENADLERLSGRLTDFLESDLVLRWYEMATIINYSGDYSQLLDNVLDVLKISHKEVIQPSSVFETFRLARHNFFSNWAYILGRTTPWVRRPRYKHWKDLFKRPEDFGSNENGRIMMALAQEWGQKSFENFSGLADSPFASSESEDNEDGEVITASPSDLASLRRGILPGSGKRIPIGAFQCPYCKREVDGYKFGKHLDFSCTGLDKGQRKDRFRNRR